MTRLGVILGTATYMVPEQARGRAVDKRVDIWAFGCVLFEMLTGARAFDGEDVAETLGAVIHKEPAWSALPTDTLPYLRTLLRRCLQKDPKKRLPHIGIARIEIDEGPAAVQPLFQIQPRLVTFAGLIGYGYDVSADGQRFLVNTLLEETSVDPITLLVNWPTLLRR